MVDARGRPVAGAAVVLINNGVGYLATAKSDGHYVLAQVAPGQYVGSACLLTPSKGDEGSLPRVIVVGAGTTSADFRLHWIERPPRTVGSGATRGRHR